MDFGYPQTTESKILQECVCLFVTSISIEAMRLWDEGGSLNQH